MPQRPFKLIKLKKTPAGSAKTFPSEISTPQAAVGFVNSLDPETLALEGGSTGPKRGCYWPGQFRPSGQGHAPRSGAGGLAGRLKGITWDGSAPACIPTDIHSSLIPVKETLSLRPALFPPLCRRFIFIDQKIIQLLPLLHRGNDPTRSCPTSCPRFSRWTAVFRRDLPSFQCACPSSPASRSFAAN
jgi:hypothetical protein